MIDFKFEGSPQLKEFVLSMTKYLKNPKITFKKCSLIMLKDIDKHFKNEEGPDRKWPDLKPLTILRRRKEGKGYKILQDTGTLKNLPSPIISKAGAEVGTNIIYARAHQEGYEPRNLPQRTFIWLSDEAERNIMDIFILDLRHAGDNRQ